MADIFGPGGFGPSPFDDFMARFLGGNVPRRSSQRVDITRLLSHQTRELVEAAAHQVAQRGGTDLDAEHLLWAAARLEPTKQLLVRAGADPEAIANEIDKVMPAGEPTGQPVTLTPAANGRCSTHTRFPGRTGRRTSGRSICCWRWRPTTSRRRAGCSWPAGSPRRRCSTRYGDAAWPRHHGRPTPPPSTSTAGT